MAEIVEFRTEETIPELESMLLLLFDRSEVQAITQMRKEHEYRLHRTPKRKEDCHKYLQNEMKLFRMIQLRHKKKGNQKNSKLNNLEIAFGNRINKIFILTLRWFPEDLRNWIAYIRFCRQMRLFTSASRVLEQMLDLHGRSTPELYKIAADWEFHDCKSAEKARKYLMMGIHEHSSNKLLLKEAFKFELEDSNRRRKVCLAKGAMIEPNDPLLTSRKAECIYINSIKKIKDIELLNELMKLCANYDFAGDLEKKILNDLLTYNGDERMWDIVASRELTNYNSDKSNMKRKIAEVVLMYESALKHLPTERMWYYYLDMLIEINKDTSVLPIFKRKQLFSALSQAEMSITLPEKYYLVWVDLFQAPEKRKKLIETLQNAVQKLPHSVKMWHLLLRAHLNKGEDKQAKQVFKEGVKTLGKDALPLWNLNLMFEQLKKNNKVDEIFKEAWLQPIEISGVLRPRYLEWLVLSYGISAARKYYLDEGSKPPKCLEMHKKMIYLESIQPNVNLKSVRRAHTICCVLFGDERVDVWLDYLKFEYNTDPAKVPEVYFSAVKNLPKPLIDTFLTEINLMGMTNIPSKREDPEEKPEVISLS